ncbi:MAG: hypothetical protein ACJZ1Y_05100 [Candidatus Neomarinimicrobiota bacterium]|tara:strand:- start:350 stop:754 length:405 start_codon:yes stop_codon:yes gene_type:complete
MRNLLTFCSVLLIANINASDNKAESKTEVEINNNGVSDMQLMQSEVLPVEVEEIKKQRIQKSIREKKYAQTVLKKQQSSQINQNELIESYIDKDQKKNVLNRWSSDVRSKISVVTVKGVNGEKAIKLPSTPESN